MINKYVCLLMIILTLCSIVQCKNEPEVSTGFENSKYFSKYSKALLGIEDDDNTYNGGSNQITYLSEESPIRVSRTIVSPLRDEYFHNETIIVEVKVTSIRTDGAKNLRIWEIPSEGLSILNCSYPIVSSSVEEIIDYENSDKSSLKRKDINITQILKILMARNNNSEIKQINELLSKETNDFDTNNLTNIDINNKSQLEDISIKMLNEFNKILNNATNLDLNSSLFSNNPRNFDRNSDLDYYINEYEYPEHIEKQDYRLLKRKLLEHAFSNETGNGIRRLSFNKKHENLINGSVDCIYFEIPSLREHESIIFKYYLNTTELGKREIHSEIQAESVHHEEKTSLNIIERRPKFAITYLCPSKELITYQPTEFEFYVEYLGGDENKITLNLTINPVKNSPTEEVYCTVNPSSINNHSFSKGIKEKFNISVNYTHTGYRLSPPTITINGDETKFEPDISVNNRWNWEVKKYSELFSALVIVIALFESFFIYKQHKKEQKDEQKSQERLNEYNKTITKFTEIATYIINDKRQNLKGEYIHYQDEDDVPRVSYDS